MRDGDRVLLEDVVEHGELAMGLVRGLTPARFAQDVAVRYGTERLLEIVGEAVGNLSHEVRELLPVDPRKVRGLRNILAHRYAAVDPAVVHAAAAVELPRLVSAARDLLAA